MQKDFGSFLKQKRLEKNLTQKQLSDLLFVSESAISKWEKNVSHPDISLLPKISEILNVTEHELITASIDNNTRKEKIDAKKWRTLSFTWNLFFYIAYTIALIPCFICNLAINKTLSWFFIVLSSFILSFTFTNLPKLIKKNKLIFIPLSNLLSLILLLLVCAIYSKGNWFLIATLSIILAYAIIFIPIYISKYKIFNKIKKFNDYISIFIDFILLNILLIVIDIYSVKNGFSVKHWYIKLALPISLLIYLVINICLAVRFLKINKLLKTSIILSIITFLYFIPPLLKVNIQSVQKDIDQANIFKADLSNWEVNLTLENNIHLIVFLTLICTLMVFLIFGLIKQLKKK